MITEGKLTSLILLASFIVTYLYEQYTKKGTDYFIKKLSAVDGIDEAINRSAELGQPVLVSTGGWRGGGGVNTSVAPQIIAGMSVLSYVAKKCAELDLKLIVPCLQETHLTMAQDVVKEAYYIADKSDSIDNASVLYAPAETAFIALSFREKPGGSIFVGPFYSSINIIEPFARIGSMVIGGTARIVHTPYFVMTCSYPLIGEEIYALSAYLSQDPKILSGIRTQDYWKFISLILMLIGISMSLFGSSLSILFSGG